MSGRAKHISARHQYRRQHQHQHQHASRTTLMSSSRLSFRIFYPTHLVQSNHDDLTFTYVYLFVLAGDWCTTAAAPPRARSCAPQASPSTTTVNSLELCHFSMFDAIRISEFDHLVSTVYNPSCPAESSPDGTMVVDSTAGSRPAKPEDQGLTNQVCRTNQGRWSGSDGLSRAQSGQYRK